MDVVTRVEQKIASHSNDFSNRQEIALNVFQELAREADSIPEMSNVATYTLFRLFDYDTKVSIFEDGDRFASFPMPHSALERIVLGETVSDRPSNIHYIPMRGKNSLRAKIGYPCNDKCVVGVFSVGNQDRLSDSDKHFLSRYAGRIAMASHHGIAMDIYADQNQLMKDFSEFMRHELKNPLSIIGGFAQRQKEMVEKYLSLAVSDPSKTMELLRKFHRYAEITMLEAERIENSANFTKIMDISPEMVREMSERIPVGKAEELIRAAVDSQNFSKRYNIVFSKDRDLIGKEINMPKSYYGATLTNLFDNSLKNTPPGGTILLCIYQDKGDFVIDSINEAKKILTPEELSTLGTKGKRFLDRKDTGFGLDKGIGLYMIGKLIREGYLGRTDLRATATRTSRALSMRAQRKSPITVRGICRISSTDSSGQR